MQLLERRPVEQRGREHVHQVEPAAGLPDVLDDEVARVVVLEPVAVLERVVHLGVRHRAGVEPDVEDVGDPAHGRAAGRVVRVRPSQLVDVRPVQVGDLHPEVRLQLGDRAVDVGPRVGRVVGLPDRDRAAQVAVPADRPVPRVRQPLAELAVLDVLGHPGDLLVQLDHPVPERGHLDEPAGHRLVDQRIPAAPAVRVGVLVRLLPEQHRAFGDRVAGAAAGPRLEVVDDRRFASKTSMSRVLVDGSGEPAVGADRERRP